jgi:acetyl esterase/lipase
MQPSVDPELVAALDALSPELKEPLTADGIPAVRRALDELAPSDAELRRGGAVDVVERNVSTDAGDLQLLVCRPRNLSGPAPGVYVIHGGGMVAGDRRSDLEVPLGWIEQLNVVVASVEYRLAPEHPYPAGVNDCYEGLRWVAANAASLDIDPKRLVIAGSSAGGGLAAAVALMCRDRGGPSLAGQVLMCPMLDDRQQTPSSREAVPNGLWDPQSNQTGWIALLGEARGTVDVSPYAAPARASDLTNLPPAFIDVGAAEVFRDEDVDYAVRIWQAGGEAELHVWPGGYHSFDVLVPDAPVSRAARAARVDWLGRLLGSGDSGDHR